MNGNEWSLNIKKEDWTLNWTWPDLNIKETDWTKIDPIDWTLNGATYSKK